LIHTDRESAGARFQARHGHEEAGEADGRGAAFLIRRDIGRQRTSSLLADGATEIMTVI
jgi:hypothetical protein